MTGLIDLFVFAFLLFVAILGASRGLVRSFLNLAAWIGASAITALARPSLSLFFRSLLEEPIVADVLAVVVPFVVSLVLLQILFGFFPKYTRKFFPKRWDHILGLIFGLALALLILTFSWTLAVAVAPFVTEQEVLARSRGVQLIRVLSAPSRGLLNRLLPSEYQLPDGQEENEETNSEETGTGASRILELEDGTRIALPAPPDGQAVRRATGYGSGVASGLGGSPVVSEQVASEEVQRIQEALDALLKSSEGAIGKAAPASTKSAIQEEIAPTATSLPTLLSEPAGKSGTDEEFAALRRLNKLLEDHETLQQDSSGNSFVPDLPQFTREDLPAVQSPEAERHIQQLLRGLESLRSIQ